MKKTYLILLFIISLSSISNAQSVIWFQGFETSDSVTLPAGWTVWNNTLDTIDPFWNWTVRDTGASLPGLATATSKAHSGLKSIGVSWYAATGGTSGISDAWLVTQKIPNVPSDGLISYWMTGGSTSYSDSVQIWISTTDSTPAAFLSNPNNYYERIFYPVGSTYGFFQQYFIDLAPYAGQDIYIGYRYNMDTQIDGFFVQLDDIEFQGTVGISQLGTNIPSQFSLSQNYPNPFNPVTKINFDLPKSSNVKLNVFNSLGQLVMNIFDGYQPAGSYQAEFNGRNLSSGTYYYRLEADNYTATKKMQLIK